MLPQIEVFFKKRKKPVSLSPIVLLAVNLTESVQTNKRAGLAHHLWRLSTKIPDIYALCGILIDADYNTKILDMSGKILTHGNSNLELLKTFIFQG